MGDDHGGREDPGHRRCARGPEFGDGRHDAGAAEDLPLDVKGRPAAGVGREDSSTVPHAARLHAGDRRVVAVAAGLTPIGTLGNLVSIGTLLAFVIVSIGIIVLRRTQPDLPRPFRMPMVPLLPLLSALVSLLLMMSLPWATWSG